MPFNYDYYKSPYTGTIAELMRRPYDIQANRALDSANRTTALAGNLAQIGTRTMGDVMKGLVEQRQKNAEVAGQAIAQSSLRQAEDGSWSFDRDFLLRSMHNAKIPQATQDKILDSVSHIESDRLKVQETKGKLNEAHRDLVAGLAWGVHNAGNTPEALKEAVDYGVKNKIFSPEEAAPWLQAAGADPTQIGIVTSRVIAQSPKYAGMLQKAEPKTREIQTVGPDGKPVTKIVPDVPSDTTWPVPPKEPPTPPVPGSEADAIARWAKRKGLNVADLTDIQVNQARAEHAAAVRAPKEPTNPIEAKALADAVLANPSIYTDLTDSAKTSIATDLARRGFKGFGASRGLSPEAKAVIERWRYDKLAEAGSDQATKDAIEAVYRAQLGEKPVPAPNTKEMYDANVAAAEGTPKPSVAAPNPAAEAVPPSVTTLLKTQAAGRYTLSDGTVWEKAADGTVRRLK